LFEGHRGALRCGLLASCSSYDIGGHMTRFWEFFNPATGESIDYTVVAEHTGGSLVRFNWRSAPGGVITEHIHPHQEERFIILAGEAHFTVDGAKRAALAGETVVIPAGARHSEGNPGPGDVEGVVELRPGRLTKRVARGLGGSGGRWRDDASGRAEEPAPARRHLLALPPREQGDIAAHLGPEPHAAHAVDAGQGVRRQALLRTMGQPCREVILTTSWWCVRERPG
jgi:quercetin dioxygenase-like cupin family protein